MDMITVFDFRYDYDVPDGGVFIFIMVASAVALLVGLIYLFLRLTNRKSTLGWTYCKEDFYVLFFGVAGCLISTPFVLIDRHNANQLCEAYEQNRIQTVEGVVKVEHKQPETGHDEGDIICVDGKRFEIDYFVLTRAYRQTIAHGGVLKDGQYAKIYYYDGQILRIDIPKNNQSGKTNVQH